MTTLDKRQNMRKQLLQYHYDLSGGYSLKPVLRPEIAKKFDFGDDYNNQELLSAYKYLEDKGFLKTETNVEDSITQFGIDEVEDGYPSLPGELIKTTDSDPLVERMQKLVEQMREAEAMCKQGLLENIPFHELLEHVEREMAEVVSNLDKIWQLKCKKLTRDWRNVPKSGFCRDTEVATRTFTPWLELITETIESTTGEKPRINESYIRTGTPYTARRILREILAHAKDEIAIVDNYLHPDIIAVTESYLINNSSLKVKFLTSDMPSNKNFKGFKSDFLLFKQEYLPADIQAVANTQCHGRFLILDGNQVYHSGHSFHDLGKKGDHLNKIEDEKSRSAFITDFNSWWTGGAQIS